MVSITPSAICRPVDDKRRERNRVELRATHRAGKGTTLRQMTTTRISRARMWIRSVDYAGIDSSVRRRIPSAVVDVCPGHSWDRVFESFSECETTRRRRGLGRTLIGLDDLLRWIRETAGLLRKRFDQRTDETQTTRHDINVND